MRVRYIDDTSKGAMVLTVTVVAVTIKPRVRNLALKLSSVVCGH